jgi:hypothetical protein
MDRGRFDSEELCLTLNNVSHEEVIDNKNFTSSLIRKSVANVMMLKYFVHPVIISKILGRDRSTIIFYRRNFDNFMFGDPDFRRVYKELNSKVDLLIGNNKLNFRKDGYKEYLESQIKGYRTRIKVLEEEMQRFEWYTQSSELQESTAGLLQ